MENDEKKELLPKEKLDDIISTNQIKETNKILENNEIAEVITEKFEDRIFNLPDLEKDKLREYSLKELKGTSTVQFNTLYDKLSQQVPIQIQIPPSEILHPELVSHNTESTAEVPVMLAPIDNLSIPNLQEQKTDLSSSEQRIYGELYIYHVLSSKTPTLEKTPTLWTLQSTFLKVKNDYLKTKYPQTRAMRNFNPGNLKMNGDKGRDKGNYAIFSSLEKGRNALINNIERWKRGESKIYQPSFTLIQFFTKYADPKGAVNYAVKAAQIMSKLTGMQISPNKTPIKNIPTKAFATAIAAKEDGNCYRALKEEGFIQ